MRQVRTLSYSLCHWTSQLSLTFNWLNWQVSWRLIVFHKFILLVISSKSLGQWCVFGWHLSLNTCPCKRSGLKWFFVSWTQHSLLPTCMAHTHARACVYYAVYTHAHGHRIGIESVIETSIGDTDWSFNTMKGGRFIVKCENYLASCHYHLKKDNSHTS